MAILDPLLLAHVVAENVRSLRKVVQMTQAELADAAGISRASVAQIEGQRYNSFILATLEGIAAAHKTNPAALLKQPSYTLTQLVEDFRESPWAAALKLNESEITTLNSVIQSLNCHPKTPLALVAEL